MPERRPTASILFAAFVSATLASPTVAAETGAHATGFAGAYLSGHIAEQRGESGVAADKLAEAMILAPETPALKRRVVRLQAGEGQFDDAVAGAKALAEAGDDNFPIGLLRVAGRFKADDFASAAALAAEPRQTGLSTVVALLARAWATAGAGDVDGATKQLTDAVKDMAALKVLLTMHAALIADQAGRDDLASWMYDEALNAAEADGQPPSPRLIQAVASYRYRQGDQEGAAEVRAKAPATYAEMTDVASNAPVVASPAQGLAEALYNFAGSLYADRQYRQALIYARLSEALRPKDPATLFTIAQTLEASRRHEAAATAYAAVPRSGVYVWRAPLRAAENLADADKTDEAVKALQQLVETAAEEPEPAIALGHMLRRESRFEEAFEAYEEATRRKGGLGPEDGWLRYARGVALERAGDWPAAEKEFEEALKTLGDEPLVLNYLGYTWIDRGERLEEARDMVARAVELRPDDGFIRDSLGWAEYRIGDFEAAAATLERAVALQPLDPIINEHLGDAYWQVGRYREARFQWRRALSFEPEEKQIPIIEEKLKCGVDGCPSADAPAKKDADGG